MVSADLQKAILSGKVKGGLPSDKNDRNQYYRCPVVDKNVD